MRRRVNRHSIAHAIAHPKVQSESRAWEAVNNLADRVLKRMTRMGIDSHDDAWRDVVNILTRSSEMLDQLGRGVHTNPPLVLVTNPPSDRHKFVGMRITLVGQLSQDVHSVAYTHIDDGVDYRHDFERRTDLLAGETPSGQRVLVLLNPDGMAVWDRFD